MTSSRRDFLGRTVALGSAAVGLGRASGSVSAAEGGPAPPARRGNPIGVSTYSFWQFRGERLGIEDCIDRAAAMGFDGVEILHVQMREALLNNPFSSGGYSP